MPLVREMIDAVRPKDPTSWLALALSYLTTGRASELAGARCEIHGDGTDVPYGPTCGELTVQEVDVEKADHQTTREQALLIPLTTLKRRDHQTRIIALPLKKEYEPWAEPITRYARNLSQSEGPDYPLLPISRKELFHILNRYGFEGTIIAPEVTYKKRGSDEMIHRGGHSILNPMRHIRATHLAIYYGFTGYQIPIYTGWKFSSSFRGTGGAGPMDAYLNLSWNEYFSKLCRPLPGTTSEAPRVPA